MTKTDFNEEQELVQKINDLLSPSITQDIHDGERREHKENDRRVYVCDEGIKRTENKGLDIEVLEPSWNSKGN